MLLRLSNVENTVLVSSCSRLLQCTCQTTQGDSSALGPVYNPDMQLHIVLHYV